MAIKWKSMITLVKPETVYATDPTPTGAANAMLLKNVELRPMEGQDVSRDLMIPFIGNQGTLPTGIYTALSFEYELVGSGETGVAPAWSPLIRACGVQELVTEDDDPGDGMVEYTPVTDNHESVAVYFWIGTTKHVMLGCRGTGGFSLNAQGIPVFKGTITGLFTVPANAARAVVDLDAFQIPQIATKVNTPTFTIDGIAFVLRDFTFEIGNDVQQRLLIGKEEILIVDRAETAKATVEAVPMGTFNPFQRALDATPVPIVLQHGTVVGKRVKFEAETAQLKRPSGYSQNQNILEWGLDFAPQPTSAGDDQWKITLT